MYPKLVILSPEKETGWLGTGVEEGAFFNGKGVNQVSSLLTEKNALKFDVCAHCLKNQDAQIFLAL